MLPHRDCPANTDFLRLSPFVEVIWRVDAVEVVPRAVPVQHVARGAEVVAKAVEAPPDGAHDGLASTGTALYVGVTDTWRGKEGGGGRCRG